MCSVELLSDQRFDLGKRNITKVFMRLQVINVVIVNILLTKSVLKESTRKMLIKKLEKLM